MTSVPDRPYARLTAQELEYQMACNRREQQKYQQGSMLRRLQQDYAAMMGELNGRDDIANIPF